MNAAQMLATAILLGLFILAAGAYGLLYGLGQLRHRRDLLRAGFVSYLLQMLIAIAVILATPLTVLWKVFIALSCALFFFLPGFTWRYLVSLHEQEEHEK